MKLTFTRPTQEKADALRKLLEETVEREKTGYGLRDDAFKITANATLRTYGGFEHTADKGKRWDFEVGIETTKHIDEDEMSEHFHWAKLLERLIARPAIKRGTEVRVQRELTAAQWDFIEKKAALAVPAQNFDEVIVGYIETNSKRHTYQDSEGRWPRTEEIAYSSPIEIQNNTIALVVDALDAPAVDSVLLAVVNDIERDRERALKS
jgi:hypothetical protein